MVQTMNNGKSVPQHYERPSAVVPKPQTVIIVYDQPKVVVVRHYTRTIIPHVNPEEYSKKFNNVLLDTSTLLALTRRLNIQENLV